MATTETDSGTTTVLIVDDHPSFRASARRLLEAEGFEVVGEAEDGRSAMESARELDPDVLLLDVQLPDASGLDIAARLTSLDDPPDVVLVSSREASDYGSALPCSGARGFLTKAELTGDALARILR